MKLTHSRYLVDLWCARASACEPGVLEQCCEASLRDDERVQAARFRRPTTRNQHVVGRGMARTLLATDDVSPQDIEFSFNAHGKPDVIGPPKAKRPFNIAHTEGLVVFASCEIGQIGVDVERLTRSTNIDIAHRYFAKPEVDFVMSQRNDEQRRLAFLRVWTLKESFIKAIGKGLAIPLADFAFDDIDSPNPTVRMLNASLGDPGVWKFATTSPADGYIAAVAVTDHPSANRIEINVRNFETLLNSDGMEV